MALLQHKCTNVDIPIAVNILTINSYSLEKYVHVCCTNSSYVNSALCDTCLKLSVDDIAKFFSLKTFPNTNVVY